MANTNVTIRVDADLKKQADELFDDLGMSFTTAINIFIKQAIREQRIPFEVRRSVPLYVAEYNSSQIADDSNKN